MPAQAHTQGMAVWFSIDSQASSPLAKRSPLPIWILNSKLEIISYISLRVFQQKRLQMGFEPMPAPNSDVHWNRSRGWQFFFDLLYNNYALIHPSLLYGIIIWESTYLNYLQKLPAY